MRHRFAMGVVVASLSGCGGGLGVVRYRMDAKPTIAVVDDGREMRLFRDAIPDSGTAVNLPDAFKAIPTSIAETMQKEWPEAKLAGEEAKATADLILKIQYLAGYWGSANADTLKDVHFRVEVMMELWDPKTQKKLADSHWGLVDDGYGVNTATVPMDTLAAGQTINDLIARRPPAKCVDDLKNKVLSELRDWINDVKKATPDPKG